jgi:DNA repair exonuclease SbcCD ATPase subunit
LNFDFGTFLITLAAAIAILAIYRFLDRNNRSLEKVKKYADKLKDDLAAFVEQRHVTLKDYAIEIDVRQKAAKEVLSRVKEIEDSLNSRAQALDSIGKRISEYDSVLDELMGMTERADENLRRIKEESEFADTVAKKLEAAEAKLDSVMKGLPAIQAEFAKTNDENFKRYSHEMRANLERVLRATAEQADEAAKRSLAARGEIAAADKARENRARDEMSLMNANFEKAFERARVEAEKLEDAAFVKLRDSIMGRAERLQEAMEEKFQALQTMAKDRITETQALVKGHKAEYLAEAKARGEENAAAEAAIKARLEAMDLKVKEGEKAFKASLVQVAERVKNEILAYRGESATELERARTEFRASLASSEKERDEGFAKLKTSFAGLGAKALEDLDFQAKSKRDAMLAEFKVMAEDLERSLVEAKKEADYRFDALSAVNVDIERLEKALRQSMADIRTGIERDLEAAGAALGERQKEQETRLGENMAVLQSAMGGLERGMNELKSKAYENVSEKLKLFEDDFFADLKKRSEEAERKLSDWQAGLESRLSGIEDADQEERERLEKEYMESLKAVAVDFQSRLQDQIGGLENRLGVYEESISTRMANADRSLETFHASLRQNAEEQRKQAQAAIEAEFSRHELSTAEQLKKAERELSAWRESASKSMSELEAKADDKRASILKDLSGINSEVSRLSKEIPKQGAQALEAFNANYETLLADVQKRTREAEAETEARLREIRTQADETKNRVEASEARLLGKLSEDAKALAGTMDEIDKRSKSFAAQTKIFERADELKAKLDEEIEDLKAEIAKAQTFRGEIGELEAQVGKVKRLEEEVNQKMTRFMAERRRIDAMEEDFRKLLSISQAVDSKLESVTASHDGLTEVEARIRKLTDLSNEAESKYERLEKKSNVLDTTVEGIDRNFQVLQDMEKVIRNHDEDLKDIPDRIIDIKRSLETVADNSGRVDKAVERLANLDGTLKDIEGRIQAMQKAREWLAGTETRLEELAKEAQEQVKLFGDIMKSETAGARKQSGAPAMGTRETVSKLARQGWSVEEIARATKLSRGEIELILEMSPKR